MSKLASVRLEWTFTPPQYFEQRMKMVDAHHTLEIDSGRIVARVDGAFFQGNPGVPGALRNDLLARFRAVQMLDHKPFVLSRGHSTVEIFDDGHENRVIVPLTGVVAIGSVGKVGVLITDPNTGEVLYDSKRERRELIKSLGDRIAAQGAEPVLRSMLASYEAAVTDPSDEMTHLYEIEDAMKRRFGNTDKAVAALGFPRADWDRLHKLCNEAAIRQSRHRGARTPPLRDATVEELNEARSIARRIIEAYVSWLEGFTD